MTFYWDNTDRKVGLSEPSDTNPGWLHNYYKPLYTTQPLEPSSTLSNTYKDTLMYHNLSILQHALSLLQEHFRENRKRKHKCNKLVDFCSLWGEFFGLVHPREGTKADPGWRDCISPQAWEHLGVLPGEDGQGPGRSGPLWLGLHRWCKQYSI